jgi:hypothetical protein
MARMMEKYETDNGHTFQVWAMGDAFRVKHVYPNRPSMWVTQSFDYMHASEGDHDGDGASNAARTLAQLWQDMGPWWDETRLRWVETSAMDDPGLRNALRSCSTG